VLVRGNEERDVTQTLRVYVNATAVEVSAGATAIACVRAWREDEAEAVVSGRRLITDSRGLPISGDSAAQAGSIFRTVANRTPDSRAD
jgi:hypothetical protein